MREEIAPGNMLQDSLKAIGEKYKVEHDIELSRLKDRPAEWIILLRELKRG